MPVTPALDRASTPLPLAARLLRSCLRLRVRGSWRLARYIAAVVPPLHRVPLQVAKGQTLYLDMREPVCREMLSEGPRDGDPFWEPGEQAVMRRVVRPGEVAYDIGAHFGEHAVLLAQLVGRAGRVYAFEPNPKRLAGLRRTIAQHGNGEVLPYAVSSERGRAVLFVPEVDACAGLKHWSGSQYGHARQVTCEVVALDDLISARRLPRPQFVKCDVEGAELHVFRGAARTLDRRDAPILLYEANRAGAAAFGWQLEHATEFLVGLAAPRYSIFWVQGDRLVPVRHLPDDVGLFNLLAVPAALAERIV